MRLRSHLVILVLVAVLPLFAFGTLMLALDVREQKATAERGMRETVRALTLALDRELAAAGTALEVLATSPHLDTPDLRAFYGQAREVRQRHPQWQSIILTDRAGRRLVDLARPYGEPLAERPDFDVVQSVLRTGRPAVSGLIDDVATRDKLIAFTVPALRGGALRYALGVTILAETWSGLLRAQRVPADWHAVIFDQQNIVVARARTEKGDMYVGRPAPPWFAAATARADEGFVRGKGMDGSNLYVAFQRSPLSGWTVTFAAPTFALDGPSQRSLAVAAAGGAGLLVVGVALAFMWGKRIETPVAALAEVAGALAQGAPIAPAPASGVQEVDTVRRALDEAGLTLRERAAARERLLVEEARRLEAESSVTALTRSEERYRSLVAAITSVVWTTDADGGFAERQPSWEAYTGQDWPAQAGWGWMDMVHPDDRRCLKAGWSQALEGQERTEATGRLWHAATRAYRHVVARGVPIVNDDGTVREWVGTVSDVEDRKRAEDERDALLEREQAARAEAEAANRAKDEFLAVLSHELRTPLSAVYGWARILRSRSLDDAAAARALEAIERNATVQVQLIDDLLDVSRIASGKMQLNVQEASVTSVARAAVDSIRPAAEAKEIRLEIALETPVPGIRGDPERLQQVMWNLLANAVKFTPPGGRVEVVVRGAGRDAVELLVRDTGRGIRADVLPHIFERFRQEDSSSTRSHGGLGIGLTLVRHLVHLHGGTVEAASAGEGRGATFKVSLPVWRGATESLLSMLDPRPAAARLERAAPASLEGIRVLAVDDDRDTLELITAVLHGHGARVTTCEAVPEAFERLRGGTFDVILSDIEMPGEDGYALIRRLRTLPADRGGKTPAAALTAYGRMEDCARALAAGFDVHVPKPVDPVRLATIVARLAARVP